MKLWLEMGDVAAATIENVFQLVRNMSRRSE